MLIKQVQVAAMDEDAESRFFNRIVRYIADGRNVSPRDASLIAGCQELIFRARSYGFGKELEIATFVSCGFDYGADFDRRPDLPFFGILQDADLAAEFKAERLAEVLDENYRQPAGMDGQAGAGV